MAKSRTRCQGCEAPIQFQPGAGSRLCPFCGYTNLVREQRIAAPMLELKIDEIFHLLQQNLVAAGQGAGLGEQRGRLEAAQEKADQLMDMSSHNVRLSFYRACILDEMGQSTEAVYALIDLTGMEAPLPLRADTHARLAEALFSASRLEEALESAKRALELMKGHPAASFVLAKTLSELGEKDAAGQVLEKTLPQLNQRWKITFPPRRSALLLLLARVYIEQKNPHKAVVPLENLLLQETAATLKEITEAARLLGFNYMSSRKNKEEGLTLIRHSALLDPENRMGLLDDLQLAVERVGGNVQEEMLSLVERRKEILKEIQQVFQLVDNVAIQDPAELLPEVEVSSLGADPDKRTDLLESAALRLGLKEFDRGTLYPLKTIEDFRRWVVACRMRQFLRKLKRDEVEEDRIVKLKAAREVSDSRATYHRHKDRLDTSRRKQTQRRIVKWTLLSLPILAVLLILFLALVGDRFLDRFEGKLIRVECSDHRGTPPCTLHIATGKTGQARYREREEGSWFTRLLAGWLDRRVSADGTVVFPLDYPWGSLSVEPFWKCQGKRIRKSRFSFRPVCGK